MGWLEAGSLPTGARWSCAAYWADSTSPDPSDTDWEDAGDWPRTYDPDAALRLGVYVAGVDITASVRDISWNVGKSEPMPSSVDPSSCNLTFKAGTPPDVLDRIVVLNQWGTLWAGLIESAEIAEAVGSITVVVCSAIDDLARATPAKVSPDLIEIGGDVESYAGWLLTSAGVPNVVTGEPGWAVMEAAPRSGSVLAALGDALYTMQTVGAWCAGVLRLETMDLHYDPNAYWVETYDEFDTLSKSLAIAGVITSAHIYEDVTPSEQDFEFSTDTYGPRPWELDSSEYVWNDADYENAWQAIISGDADAGYSAPLERIKASGSLARYRHSIGQLLPFDNLWDDVAASATEVWRVLQVKHRVTPDSYRVDIEGVRVRDYFGD